MMTDDKPTSAGWYWRRARWDDYQLIGPLAEMRKLRGPAYVASLDGDGPFSFRDYASLCWWCGSHGINAKQA